MADSATGSACVSEQLIPQVHCTVPHDTIKLQCPRGYEEKDSLFNCEIKGHIDSATVSSTIIAIIYKTISGGDNGSKTGTNHLVNITST